MTLARVVSFEGVERKRIEELEREIREDERPDDVPATEILMLHDPETETALAILFFEDEESYRRGDEALSAMPADETPGRRTAVRKYHVAGRLTR